MISIAFAFTDRVTKKPVYFFEDAYGRFWMATNRWGFDRETAKRSWSETEFTKNTKKENEL